MARHLLCKSMSAVRELSVDAAATVAIALSAGPHAQAKDVGGKNSTMVCRSEVGMHATVVHARVAGC